MNFAILKTGSLLRNGVKSSDHITGYNHIIPDILTFPPESELEEERDIWGKHRLIVTDEMRQKLGDDYPEDKMVEY